MQTALIIVLSVANAWQIFSPSILNKRRESDRTDDRLISLLKASQEALEKRVAELEVLNKANEIKISELENSNRIMTKILQGRDESVVEFHKQGFEAFKIIHELKGAISKS